MLSDSLIKVEFSAGFPSLSKQDKEISAEIAQIKGADENKIKAIKRLYDSSFTRFEKITRDFRNRIFYAKTERWGNNFILPSSAFNDFNQAYQETKEKFN